MSRALLRLESRVARALAGIIHEMQDPRIPMVVTIERVRLSADLSRARVLISALERVEETAEVLNRAHGYLQEELAHEVPMRRVPRITFHTDPREVL